MPIGIGTGLAISAGGSLLGGLFGAGASKNAASQQAAAAKYAAQLQYQMYEQTVKRLQPWTDQGTAAVGQLGGLLGLPGQTSSIPGWDTGSLVKPFQPTMAQLQQTPGYQFTLQQGEQATTNAAAAMGLGQSGSLLKGASSYAEGLASTTYQQQFNNYWAQLGQVYNELSGISTQGANAAALQGQAGQQTATSAGNFLTSGAAASAAGTIGAASALTQGLTGAASLPLQMAMFNKLGQFAGGGGGSQISAGTDSTEAV